MGQKEIYILHEKTITFATKQWKSVVFHAGDTLLPCARHFFRGTASCCCVKMATNKAGASGRAQLINVDWREVQIFSKIMERNGLTVSMDNPFQNNNPWFDCASTIRKRKVEKCWYYWNGITLVNKPPN